MVARRQLGLAIAFKIQWNPKESGVLTGKFFEPGEIYIPHIYLKPEWYPGKNISYHKSFNAVSERWNLYNLFIFIGRM